MNTHGLCLMFLLLHLVRLLLCHGRAVSRFGLRWAVSGAGVRRSAAYLLNSNFVHTVWEKEFYAQKQRLQQHLLCALQTPGLGRCQDEQATLLMQSLGNRLFYFPNRYRKPALRLIKSSPAGIIATDISHVSLMRKLHSSSPPYQIKRYSQFSDELPFKNFSAVS